MCFNSCHSQFFAPGTIDANYNKIVKQFKILALVGLFSPLRILYCAKVPPNPPMRGACPPFAGCHPHLQKSSKGNIDKVIPPIPYLHIQVL